MASLTEEIQQNLCDYFGIPSLKEHQVLTLDKVLVDKRDAFIVLPTGMGKSLCFEALTHANSLLHGSHKDIVLLVSPLNWLHLCDNDAESYYNWVTW
jgi:superfamily II DNA helicase RecQ